MQRQYKRYSYWTAIVVVMVLLSLVVVYFQSQNQDLDVYKNEESHETPSETEEIKLETIFNAENNFRIGIPKDWRHVVKDGYDTYIHSPSATSVQIQVADYYPQLLTVTQESVFAELNRAGCSLLSFGWESPTSYFSIFTQPTSQEEYLKYIELTSFDKNTVIRIVQIVESQYEQYMLKTMLAIVDSFEWGAPAPFPDGVYMCYSEFGNYEFAYPQGWQAGTADNTYYFQDSNTGATLSVSAYKSSATYKEYTKFDYVDYASQGRPNFILLEYSADEKIIYAQASYISNGATIIMTHYLIATGTYEYAIAFETSQSTYGSQTALIKAIINSFRTF